MDNFHSFPQRMGLCAILLFSVIASGLAGRTELFSTSDCICSGENVTYSCSVAGGQFTVWSGSIMADNCVVALPHMQFLSSPAYCNNRAIVGRGISQENNCYTSTLTFLANQDLEGRTIECGVDNVEDVITIGSTTLLFTTDPFSAPTAVQLSEIQPTRLTFSWNQPTGNCSSLNYNIIADNCGKCQNMTSMTQTTCTNFTLSKVCIFQVNSVICGDLESLNTSNIVTVNLKVPETPSITGYLPFYAESDDSLLRLITTFNTVDPFIITDGIDGSPTSYTIIYSDAISEIICGSVTIPASICQSRFCSYESTYPCPSSSDITLRLFATNLLGNSSTTNQISIDGINNFVNVEFSSNTREITCTFLNQQQDITKRCLINITYGENCELHLGTYGSSGPSISLPSPSIDFLNTVSEYCYAVTATSGNKTVVIEGNLNILTRGGDNVITAVSTMAIILLIVLLVSIVATIYLMSRWYQKKLTPATVRFSNSIKPGSLASMLKVFEDHGINILRVNTVLDSRDLKKNRPKKKENFIHFECDGKQMEKIINDLGPDTIEFLEDDDPSFLQQELEKTEIRPVHAVLTVVDTPGALRRCLSVIAEQDVVLQGLNRSRRSTEENKNNYCNNYVSCLCSERKLKHIREELEAQHAKDVKIDFSDPREWNQVIVIRDRVRAMVKVLEVFSSEDIHINSFNYCYPAKKGLQTQLVECIYKEEHRQNLYHMLRKSGAVNVQKHVDECFRRKNLFASDPDYFIVKFSLRDETGALAAVLQVFDDLKIKVIGVNTLYMYPEHLSIVESVEKMCVDITFTRLKSEEERELLQELLATEFVIEADPTHMHSDNDQGSTMTNIKFSIKCEVETLAKALNTFAKFGVNISSLHHNSSSKESVTVEYKRNYIVFHCTSEQESQMRAKLLASGIVVSYDEFKKNDWPIITQNESSATEDTQEMSQDTALELAADERIHGHTAQAVVTFELADPQYTDRRKTEEVISTV